MKKLSNKIVWLCIAFGLLFHNASGSHISGGNITYSYLGPLTYLVKYRFFHECSGIPAPTMLGLCYQSLSLGVSGNVTLSPAGPAQILSPNFCDANFQSFCFGGNMPGLEEIIYEDTLQLPAPANDWKISYYDCCRSAFVVNVSGGSGITIYSDIDNLSLPVNSSPEFLQPPVQNFCIGVYAAYNFGSSDADGDSLVYSLASCLDGGGCPVLPVPANYNNGYSPDSFLISSTPIIMDPITGILYFTPVMQQTVALCVRVDEYRNGIKIGCIMRDVILTTGLPHQYNYIKGHIYLDLNYNYIFDSTDQGIKWLVPETFPVSYYGITDSSGTYQINIPDTGYFIHNLPFVLQHYNVIQNQQSSYFPTFGNIDSNNDFIIQMIPNISDVQVSITKNASSGNHYFYSLHYRNTGTDTSSGIINLIRDTILQFLQSAPSPSLTINDTLQWTYSNLRPLEQRTISLEFIASVINPFTPVTLFSYITPVTSDVNTNDNNFILGDILLASHDPNYKEIQPPGDVSLWHIQNQDDLLYTIHFQNTGTDTAVNIIITDQLDPDLFIPSFRLEASSAPCTLSFDSMQALQFTFSNIQLPDSGADQFGSCGFVSYRIKPKYNLQAGDMITNEANIYFDSNAPVLTNQTITHIVSGTGIPENKTPEINWFPNPATNKVFFSLPKAASAIPISFVDLTGQIKKETTLTPLSHAIDISDLKAGVYFLRLNYNKRIVINKLIVIK